MLRLLLIRLLCVLSLSATAIGGSATWSANPTSGDWNTPANWNPNTVPNGPNDVATFGVSTQTQVSVSANIEVNQIVFDPGASPYTIAANAPNLFTISGVGVTNNSGTTQNFVANGDGNSLASIVFTNSATAGSLTAFTDTGGTFANAVGGVISFVNTSTAGNGTFTTNGGLVSGAHGGTLAFGASATAGNGIFTTNGAAVSGADGGIIQFSDTSTAGNGTFITNGGGFGGGGMIQFSINSTGGTSRIEVFGDGLGDFTNGHLDISQHLAPGVTIGSLEGSGFVQLGANKLTVGANNLTTAFSGLIKDGGSGGSLAKTGRGRFTLNKVNTYIGGTTVTQGTLLVGNRTGSCTGTGPVAINAGTLGGTGKISGAVTIGTATTAAALAPGSRAELGTLTLSNTLTFNARGNYQADLNSTLIRTDQVAANGVTINSGATATITDLGTGTLTTGTVFTIINNTANTPISGTFSNLADGSTLVIGSNTYLVSYEGGTGNDLTLTVVP